MIEFIQDTIGAFIYFIADKASQVWQNFLLLDLSLWQMLLDVALVGMLFYWIIIFLKGSRAINILFGLIVIGLVFLISRVFNLFALNWLLNKFLTVVLVAIPIIFQQELRHGLENLGRTKFFRMQQRREAGRIISDVVSACKEMTDKGIGALIVFQHKNSLKEYIENGVKLNAELSNPLLLSIFNKQSPLHDGAVIVENGRVLAASCVLPHSFKKYPHTFGTRHKAAIGLSETTDAKIILISEEKRNISFITEGEVEMGVTEERLAERMRQFLISKRKKK